MIEIYASARMRRYVDREDEMLFTLCATHFMSFTGSYSTSRARDRQGRRHPINVPVTVIIGGLSRRFTYHRGVGTVPERFSHPSRLRISLPPPTY